MDKLAALRERIIPCQNCELRAGCTQVVPPSGPVSAHIAFYGEGPGEVEDEVGEPFRGRTGKFLREHMERNGIKPDEVLIDNTVRCRPPDNRDPLPEEIEACWPWTVEVLKTVRPRIIVTLGKPALMTIARKFSLKKDLMQGAITKSAGKPVYVEKRGFYVFPMFHPSYAVRRNDARRDFAAHMEYLRHAIPGWLERPL